MSKIKRHPFQFILCIVSILLGIYMLVQDVNQISQLIFGIIGVALIILASTRLYTTYKETGKIIILPLVTLAIGILLLFELQKIIFIIIAIFLLFEPISNIVKSDNKKQQLIFELPEIIFAIVLVILSTSTLFYAIVFRILGVLSIIIGIYLAIALVNEIQVVAVPKNKNRDIIDR